MRNTTKASGLLTRIVPPLAILVVAAILPSCQSGERATTEGTREAQEINQDSASPSDPIPVVSAHADFERPHSIGELVDRSTAAVVAKATQSSQWAFNEGTSAELVNTRQVFEIETVLWGEVGEELAVHFTGGLQQNEAGETYMLELAETPQYEPGATYLLVLWKRAVGDEYVPTGTEEDFYVGEGYNVVGPATGRYKVVDGVLRDVTVDIQARPKPTTEGGEVRNLGFDELVGQPLEEARGRLINAHSEYRGSNDLGVSS